jgi:polyphosphate kinase
MQHKPVTPSHISELDQPDLYINRELSWIEFNRRVFEQAQDSRHPLLERVKFLSIFDTNLDEFIMVRVAGMKDQLVAHVPSLSPDGLTAEQQMIAVRQTLAPLVQEVCHYWRNELIPMLAAHSIYILDYEQLDAPQRNSMRTYFEREVFPVLTPLAVDQGHPFPHISNRSLNLAVAISGATQSATPRACSSGQRNIWRGGLCLAGTGHRGSAQYALSRLRCAGKLCVSRPA